MKKTLLSTLTISALLTTLLVGMQVVEMAKADPFPFEIMDEVPPDNSTKPPIILILSPVNNTSYSIDNLVLSITSEVGFSATAAYAPHPYISEVYYKIDYQMVSITIYEYGQPQYGSKTLSKYNVTISLKSLAEGNHTLTVYAVENGRYESNNGSIILYYPFKITGSTSTYFAVDNTPPSITNLSLENKTYTSTEIPLKFNINDEASGLAFSLDNQANTTISGNTTLTGLTVGSHNLTLYANDTAGNIGKSDTVFFAVNTQPLLSSSPTPAETAIPSLSAMATQQPQSSPNPQPPTFQTELAIASVAGVAAIAVGAIGVVVFRRKKQSNLSSLKA